MQSEHTASPPESSTLDLRRRAHKIIQDARYNKKLRADLFAAVQISHADLPEIVARLEFAQLASELVFQAIGSIFRPLTPAVRVAVLNTLSAALGTPNRGPLASSEPAELPPVDRARELTQAICLGCTGAAKPLAQLLRLIASIDADPRDRNDIVHECLAVAFTNAPSFDDSLRAWLDAPGATESQESAAQL